MKRARFQWWGAIRLDEFCMFLWYNIAMQEISRRTFFIRTATLAGAAAVAPLFSGCTPGSWSSSLSQQESGILTAVTETLYPSIPDSGKRTSRPNLTSQLIQFLSAEPLATRRLFRGALWVVELSSIPSFGMRFRSLGPSQREAHFLALQDSRFATSRTAIQGILKAAYFVDYSQPDSWEAIGYDGPWIKAVTP